MIFFYVYGWELIRALNLCIHQSTSHRATDVESHPIEHLQRSHGGPAEQPPRRPPLHPPRPPAQARRPHQRPLPAVGAPVDPRARRLPGSRLHRPGLRPRAAATVGRCLRLHAERGAPLDALRVVLVSPPGPGAVAFARDVIGWIAAAVARGAREVNVDTVAGGRRSRERRRRVPGSPRRPVPSTPCRSIHAAGTSRRARPRQRRSTHHGGISGEQRIDPIAYKVSTMLLPLLKFFILEQAHI